MESFKQFWTTINRGNMFPFIINTRERLVRAAYCRMHRRRTSFNPYNVDAPMHLLGVLELIGLKDSPTTTVVRDQLKREVAQLSHLQSQPAPTCDEQFDMKLSLEAVGVALENIETLPQVIVDADSEACAVSALCERFGISPAVAEVVVELGSDGEGEPENESHYASELLAQWKSEKQDSSRRMDRSITPKYIALIAPYLSRNNDAGAYEVLARLEEDASWDCLKAGLMEERVSHLRKSADALVKSCDIALKLKTLRKLAHVFDTLGQEYVEAGEETHAVLEYSTALQIFQYLNSVYEYLEPVAADLESVESSIKRLTGEEDDDEDEEEYGEKDEESEESPI